MYKKTILSTTLAALVAAGSLGFTATEAAAKHKHHNGVFISFGFGHKVCEPIFKKKVWWKNGKKHVKTIYVGKDCHWQPFYFGH